MKVALLGRGTMGGFHAATLAGEPGVEVRTWDADPARRTVDSLEAALDGAQAAVVATPAATHAELVERCLGAGVAVFCEKPLALDLAAARRLAGLADQSGAVLQVGFQRRHDAVFGRLRERVAAGELGRIHAFTLATFDRTPPPRSYIPTSGGLFRDMHIHDFDAIRWLLGEVAEVQALGAVLVDQAFAESGDVDTSALSLRMESGALGVIAGARANPAGYVARLDVYGSRDAASVREDRPYRDFLDRYPDAYRAELRSFLAAVRGEVEVGCTARDGVEALRVAEAAERSLRERRPVALADI